MCYSYREYRMEAEARRQRQEEERRRREEQAKKAEKERAARERDVWCTLGCWRIHSESSRIGWRSLLCARSATLSWG